MNVLLAESVLAPMVLAGPPLVACCWLLWRVALGPPCRAAGARAKRWFRRHRTGVWVGAGAVVIAVIAVALVSEPRQPDDDLAEVLVVSQDLPIQTLLDEGVIRSHLGRAQVQRDQTPFDVVGDERLVLGRMTYRYVRAGQYLTDTDVGPVRFGSGYDGVRDCWLKLGPDDWVAEAFRVGDRVDLVVRVRVGGDRVTAEPVIERLLVLCVNAAGRVLAVGATTAQLEAIRTAEGRGDLRAVRSSPAE